jgi:hypothetical protein
VGGLTGFSLFWPDLVEPLLRAARPEILLEIGADEGDHTRLLISFVDEATNSRLHVIEPRPRSQLLEMVERSSNTTLHEGRSQDVLPSLAVPPEATFIEGDLNYVSILSDLQNLSDLSEAKGVPFPLTFVKNTSWPYARRDMYYDPACVSEDDRHPFRKAGMSPWSKKLVPGMINQGFWNAETEGGTRNGVLTAIEMFLASHADLSLFTIPANHGIGVIYPKESITALILRDRFACGEGLRDLMETMELARINETINRNLRKKVIGRLRRAFGGWIG